MRRAKTLLKEAAEGVNSLDGWTPSIPVGVDLVEYGDAQWQELEQRGLEEASRSAFVIVAGGCVAAAPVAPVAPVAAALPPPPLPQRLPAHPPPPPPSFPLSPPSLGERLGFNGIKLALETQTVTGQGYLEYYLEWVLALQTRARKQIGASGDLEIPVLIMTSDDTHEQTAALVAELTARMPGVGATQIELMKQPAVPALSGVDAKIALDPDDPHKALVKPHGHGDVHSLLAKHGIAQRWHDQGARWVLFLQDTNVRLFCFCFSSARPPSPAYFPPKTSPGPRDQRRPPHARRDGPRAVALLDHRHAARGGRGGGRAGAARALWRGAPFDVQRRVQPARALAAGDAGQGGRGRPAERLLALPGQHQLPLRRPVELRQGSRRHRRCVVLSFSRLPRALQPPSPSPPSPPARPPAQAPSRSSSTPSGKTTRGRPSKSLPGSSA